MRRVRQVACDARTGNGTMSEMKLLIPTYNGNLFPDQVETGQIEEYGDPEVPVTAYREAGLRIVLGTHDPEEDSEKPDLLIERQPNAWAVFIHPDGGDPSAYIYIVDDGRTFLFPEFCPGSPTEIVHELDQVPGLRADPPPAHDRTLRERRNPPRFLPRRIADMGIIGCAIREAIVEVYQISAQERLDPIAIENIINKHLARLARPRT